MCQETILDPAMVERLGVDYSIDKIVHAAVFTVNRVELETQRSRDVVAINVEGTANLLELARVLKVGRFVYVSSGAAYGSAAPSDQTLNEDASPKPQNLYGITKYTSELLTHRLRRAPRAFHRQRPAQHSLWPHGAGYGTPGGDVGVLSVDRTGFAGRTHPR